MIVFSLFSYSHLIILSYFSSPLIMILIALSRLRYVVDFEPLHKVCMRVDKRERNLCLDYSLLLRYPKGKGTCHIAVLTPATCLR